MKQPLPMFEGSAVKSTLLKVTGSHDDPHGLIDPLGLADDVVIVVTGACTRIAHEEKDGSLARVQTIKAADIFVVTDATDSVDLIHKLRADRKKSLDILLGTDPLPGIDEDPDKA